MMCIIFILIIIFPVLSLFQAILLMAPSVFNIFYQSSSYFSHSMAFQVPSFFHNNGHSFFTFWDIHFSPHGHSFFYMVIHFTHLGYAFTVSNMAIHFSQLGHSFFTFWDIHFPPHGHSFYTWTFIFLAWAFLIKTTL